MRYKGDTEIWFEETKTIQQINKDDIYIPEIACYKTNHISGCIKKHKNEEIEWIITTLEHRENIGIQKLSRSEIKKISYSASIDLHGKTREIDEILKNFCATCILKNKNEVIIITGKGTGILKTTTETWLKNHPEFIIGFFPIKDSKREVGSFGVKLRKNNLQKHNKFVKFKIR